MVEARSRAVVVTAFTLTGMSTVLVATRFYSRRFAASKIRFYDAVLITALVLTWCIAVINNFQVKYNSMANTIDVTTDEVISVEWLKGTIVTWYLYQMGYLLDLALVKLTILLLYRTFATATAFRRAVYGAMGIIGVFTITMVLINAFECKNPLDVYSLDMGSSQVQPGRCYNLQAVYFGEAIFHMFSDLIILLLPIPALLKKKLPLGYRLALSGIFAVGFIAIFASIARIWTLYTWANESDLPYSGGSILIWTQVELNSGIMCATLPMLKPIFDVLFSRPEKDVQLYSLPYDGTTTPVLRSTSVRSMRRKSTKRDSTELNELATNLRNTRHVNYSRSTLDSDRSSGYWPFSEVGSHIEGVVIVAEPSKVANRNDSPEWGVRITRTITVHEEEINDDLRTRTPSPVLMRRSRG